MTLIAICLVIPQRMRLSGTVTEIYGALKIMESRPCDVIGYVTIRRAVVDFL